MLQGKMLLVRFVLLGITGICWMQTANGQNICYTTIVESYTQAVQGSTSCGLWGWGRCAKTTYRRQYRLKTTSVCCYGWVTEGTQSCQKAVCFGVRGSCPNGGTCVTPDVCSCLTGYNPPACNDINECAVSNGGCADTCINTAGSFRCECRNDGYGLAADGFSCQAVCFGNSPGLCSNGGNCIGKNVCVCSPGYDPAKDCSDADECSSSAGGCSQKCVNTPGSFHCECNSGYSLTSDGKSCLAVCGNSPPGKCPNGGSCVSPGNCQCVAGYEGTSCSDIDECSSSNGGCDRSCINTAGSYRCECDSGYDVVSDSHNKCLPICHSLTPGECPNGGTCNSPDVCACLPGFTSEQCLDINECLNNNGGCQQKCENTPGSRQCGCFSGYNLLPDGVTCEDVDECDINNGGCQQSCENSIGYYNCSCRDGFLLNVDGLNCKDIDECNDDGTFCQHECVNIPGSFACSCETGYHLDSDHTSCSDIDECSVNNGDCQHVCSNADGSFKCECKPGYSLTSDHKSCEDINECSENKGQCSDYCVNEPGSYRCECMVGYNLAADGLNCHDINECSDSNGGCVDICTNSPGTRDCSCSDGFILAADGLSCQNASKCPFNGNINCWPECTPTPPTNSCKCPNDTILHTDGNHCINPCYSSPCFNGGECHLAETTFWCDCDGSGYTGELCLQGVVSFSDDVRARAGVVSETYTIQARPKRQLVLHATGYESTSVFPNPIVITHPDTSASFQVLCKSRGLHVVTWNVSGSDAEHYTNIPPLKVPTEDVFTRLQLVGDVLPKGCFQLSIPFHDDTVDLASTLPWYSLKSNPRLRFTQGVVSLTARDSSLPVSEIGIEILVTLNKLFLSPLSSTRQIRDSQLISDTNSSSCQAISLSKQDYKEFSVKNSLLRSLLKEIGNTLPDWLHFALETSSSFLRQFSAHVTQGRDLQRIPSCNGAPVFDGDNYFVMRIKGNFIMSLVGKSVAISSPDGGSEEFCFIIGLQNDMTFVVMFPDQVSSLLQSVSIFQTLKANNIIVYPRGIGISLTGRLNTQRKISEMTFWNGDELFDYPLPEEASLWFGTEVRKSATEVFDYALDLQGNIFVGLVDVRKMFTHLVIDPWTAMLQIGAQFDLVLTVPIFEETYTIRLKDLLKVKVSALASIGGQTERQYCGPNANPPGFFVAASIEASLLRDLPIISDLIFNINLQGYFFSILDQTYLETLQQLPDNTKTYLNTIKNHLSSFLSYLSLQTQEGIAWFGHKIQVLKLWLDKVIEDISEIISARRSVEAITQFVFDFTNSVTDVVKLAEDFIQQLSLEISGYDWSSFITTVLQFIENIKREVGEMQMNFVRQLNSVITGSGSWGVKGQFSVTLLGKDFVIGAEFVKSDKNIGQCGRFSDIYQELSEEKVVRVTGYVDTEIEVASLHVTVKKPVNLIWKFFLTIDGGTIEMALAQNSNKFIVRLELIASFLGVELSANVFIRDTGMSSVMEVDVWGIFRTRLLVSYDIFVPPSEMALRVQGLFLPGGRSFDGSLGDAIRLFAKQLADNANKRITEAQKAFQTAKGKLTEAQSWLKQKKQSLDEGHKVFDRGVAALEVAKQRLEAAKGPFERAMQTLNAAQKRVDGLCRIRTCSSICIPGVKIRLCWAKVWFLRIPYPCISFTSCMIRIPNPICVLANIGCRVIRGIAFVALEVAKLAVRIPIIALDVAKVAVTVAQVVVDKARIIVEVAKVAFDLAVVVLEGVKVTFDVATAALEAVKFAVKLALHAFDFIIQYGLQKIIDIKACGFDLELSTRNLVEFEVFCELNIFSLGWTKIGFRFNFKNIAVSLWNAAKALVEKGLKALGNLFGRRKREVEFLIHSRLHKEYRQRRQANITDTEQDPITATNNTIEVSPFDAKVFWTKQCSVYQPVFSFLRQGIDILRNITAEMESHTKTVSSNSSDAQGLFSAMPNLTVESVGIDVDIAAEDFNLTREDIENALNQTQPEDDDVFNESKNTTDFILQQNNEAAERMLDYQIVPVWKAEMENLTRDIFNSTDCTGFHDCVVHSFGELYQLLDSVDPNLVNMTKSFLPELESAYFELLDNVTRGIVDVKNVTTEMLSLMDRIDVNDIFCGSAPMILESPVNVTAMKGSDVVLSCRAEGVPPPTYYWYRNSEILARGENLTTIEISGISSADEGEYTCMAGNHIYNTTAEIAHLSMVYPAQIISPLTGNLEVLTGSVVVIACPSSGIPLPTVKWYSTSDMFRQDENRPSVLRLTAVQCGMSGLYACEASNFYGRAPSTESTLNVFDGKPLCPWLDILLGYLTAPTTDTDTVLNENKIQPSSFEEAIIDAVSLLAKGNDTGVELSVEQTDTAIIQLSIMVDCDSTMVCGEDTCSNMYRDLLEKVHRVWARLQTNLDSTKALFSLNDTFYFFNPSIAELTGVASRCPSGYRQLMEFACVSDAQRYSLPPPVFNDFLPFNFKNVSWTILPQMTRFVKGYRVVLQTLTGNDVLLNTTTTSTVYDLSLHISKGIEDDGYEIWIRAITDSHQSQWARKPVETDTPLLHAEVVSYLSLGIGLGVVIFMATVGGILLVWRKKYKVRVHNSPSPSPILATPRDSKDLHVDDEKMIFSPPPPYSAYPMDTEN